MRRWWVGVDWSESLQDCAIVDDHGAVVTHLRIEETADGVAQLLTAIRNLNPRSHRFSRRQVPVVIEDGARLLVAELRRVRQPVIVIPPAVMARYRGRLATAVSKADRTDAALLANIVRMNPGRHRALAETSDEAAAVAVLARAQQDSVARATEAMLRMRSHLRMYYPAAIDAWAGMDRGLRRREARALLAVAPTPRAAAGLSKYRIAETLAAAGRTRMLDDQAAGLRELFAAPRLRQRPATEDAMGQRMLVHLAELDAACLQAERLRETITETFARHPHAPIYRSFPACGPIVAARLFAEIGDDPGRFTARGLRAYAGTAPLTWASGGSHKVTHRRICNRQLKTAVHQWAFGTLTRSPGCRARYDARRDGGDGYAAALRHVGNRLLNGLHYCLQSGDLYHEERMFPPSSSTVS
ncbi:IS110 family transposase [Streptomyces botrytidirepellens]|uniref:IS110 family transposase n=1 Tax=Streptomyces botrytidirepellens TaxID=2486417 RepID=A0A3M8SZU1_9ACTN|nr:transposase [Streptomyces botrytidirepellens]RNF86759.1 IS110 family transposase [Streptomyces botrytidirepellens]